MRVTNQMMAGSVTANLNTLRSRMADLQQQASSGKRIEVSSDDPTAGGEVMRGQSRLQLMKQWDANLGNGKTWVRNTESALSHMTDLLGRVKELAINATNSSVSNNDRQNMKSEVDEILKDLVDTLNTNDGDGSLFAGFNTAAIPFALDNVTGAVTYSGDNGVMQRDVGPGVSIDVNLHGNRLGTWSSSSNILTTVWQFAQDLANWPAGGTTSTLTDVDAGTQTLLALRAEIGAKDKRLEQVDSRMKDAYIQLQAMLQQAQGTEMAKTLIDMNLAEMTYRVALQVGARVVPPSLVDFLR